MTRALVPAALALLAVVAAGCGGAETSNAERRAVVEAMIRTQLPQSVRRNSGEAVLVKDVTCVAENERRYDCIVAVTGTDGLGGLQSFDVAVTAACDEANCTWRTTQ